MASIESYTTKKGRRWSVRYRKPTGATTTKRGFTTKKSATAFAATVETRKMEGLYIDPTAGRLHLDRLWERLDRITRCQTSHDHCLHDRMASPHSS